MKEHKKYYLGLDIGTDSVGYAVTDEQYNLLKFHSEPAWGTTIFDAASLCEERRSFRTARRRLDRRQQRVQLVQEQFAHEIEKIDPRFYIRMKESALYPSSEEGKSTIFNDVDFTDIEYYEKYPTIHHLIVDLMQSEEPHDVRLVYLACAWLVAHRGHFFSNISMDNIASVRSFDAVYEHVKDYFTDNNFIMPWEDANVSALGELIKKKMGVNAKKKALTALLYPNSKPAKEGTEEFPFSRTELITLLAGGKAKLKDLFQNEAYAELGSAALSMNDEQYDELQANIGEDYGLIEAFRGIYDWSVLVDILGDSETLSEAKVAVYEQHKKDLTTLKYLVKKYLPKKYEEVFRETSDKLKNYVAYSYHTNSGDTSEVKKCTREEFSKYILGLFKNVKAKAEDEELLEEMLFALNNQTFMPKQKDTNNRVIPHQLYLYELMMILDNASGYLAFLNERDEAGYICRDKIESIFSFRIPYFVGPLNPNSPYAWIERKAGKIYPWNFEEMVDLDASEQQFIQKLTNFCTYLPGEPVLPKDSLLYHRYMVLNEINNIRVNGEKLSVEDKQKLFNEVFMGKKKISRKHVIDFLISNGILEKGQDNLVTGIDVNCTSNLAPQIAFRRLLSEHLLTEADAERIIERASYAEDKTRLAKWLKVNYSSLSEEDRRYICKIKIKDFGRLSYRFLCETYGCAKTMNSTGEVMSIIQAMWETQDNLMELLSERYTFVDEVNDYQQEYYSVHKMTLEERLNSMYVSNAVKRPIYRTIAIVRDIEKAFGKPEKIFVETTRSASNELKGNRTKSRKQQILDLYAECKDEDVRILQHQLEEMGDLADNKLQGDKLFLYYMQLGKCMYSGQPIELEQLGSKAYDIDHIYPQSVVQDDSIINNKVLVLSSLNGAKSDTYPISADIRQKMGGYWRHLKNSGLISEEKYRRLVRDAAFTSDERMGFINRQLTETSQATKAVATILKDRYPDAEIVYCKAAWASRFRHQFDILKCRSFNDLHHAVDAYLNVVVGNVYNMRFSKAWFRLDRPYSLKTETIFTHPVTCNGQLVWGGQETLEKVIRTARKNTAHFTKYAYMKKGGYFDQMPVSAREGLVPLKKGMDTERYGGYNKPGVMFFIPVRYKVGKKSEVMILSVEMLYGEKFLKDTAFAIEYAKDRLGRILKKSIDKVDFPMGMRPWKVNTMLSLDGFRVCIAGVASGGTMLIAQPVVQFSSEYKWEKYLKKIEVFVTKTANNPNYIYDAVYDGITKDMNEELYNLYIEKCRNTVYKNRINPQEITFVSGKEKFIQLNIKDQAKVLLNIHSTFGRLSSGCDLVLIGGSAHSATTKINSGLSNWKKKWKEVRLIDSSVTGLWEQKTDNLFDVL